MSELRDQILLRRSSQFSKRPSLFDIENGELALNFNSEEPGLYFKDFSESTGTQSIRKIGPPHMGPMPPNSFAEELGFPVKLSHAETWIDTSLGQNIRILRVWDDISNSWEEVSGGGAKSYLSLDQFLDGSDGSNIVHTDGLNLKINNKIALSGYATTTGNKLVINEGSEFANGVELHGPSILIKNLESDANLQIQVDTLTVPENDFVPLVIGGFDLTFRSAKFIIQVEGFTQNNAQHVYYVMESLIIHDNFNVFMTQYGIVSTINNEVLGSIDASIQGGKVKLTFQRFPNITSEIKVSTTCQCLSV